MISPRRENPPAMHATKKAPAAATSARISCKFGLVTTMRGFYHARNSLRHKIKTPGRWMHPGVLHLSWVPRRGPATLAPYGNRGFGFGGAAVEMQESVKLGGSFSSSGVDGFSSRSCIQKQPAPARGGACSAIEEAIRGFREDESDS
jgi:hypothetical protein